MDFIEGLPKSEGKDCTVVVVDQFTKFAHFLGLTHTYTGSAKKFSGSSSEIA